MVKLIDYFTPVGVQSIMIIVSVLCACLSVCLSVCESARICQKQHVQTSQNFLYVLPVVMVRSFSDDNVMYFQICG